MSSGKVHAQANSAVILVTIVAATQLPLPVGIGAIIGSISGFLLTPDIDLPGVTHEEYRIYKSLGPLGGGMWRMFWNSYTRTHSHRGSSHAPITGTLGRWWYIFKRLWWLLAILIYYYSDFIVSHLIDFLVILFFMFVFNVIQDLTHLVLDGWKYHNHR